MNKALIIVDVQRDFCEGGSLAVDGGTRVATRLNSLLDSAGHWWEHVVATQDRHIDPGDHFSDTPDYVDSWPVHCVAGTDGAEFHPALKTDKIEAVFRKGAYAAAYSGFEGDADGVALVDWLRERGVTEVDVVGIATDYCVRATALDAVRLGFTTNVLLEVVAGVAAQSTDQALSELREAGVNLI